MSYISDFKSSLFGLFQTSTDLSAQTEISQRFSTEDGREVALVLTGSATTVAPGVLYQNPALIANHQNLAVTAVAPVSVQTNKPATITVTLGATAVVANQYAGGFLVINDNLGQGQTLKIQSHPAALGSASLLVTLEDNFVVTPDTTSEVCLIPATGNGIIIMPTTATNRPAGVGLYPIAPSTYGFVQTKGAVSCLSDVSAPVVGTPISASSATAGAIAQTRYATNVVTDAIIGSALQTAISTEYRTIFIDL